MMTTSLPWIRFSMGKPWCTITPDPSPHSGEEMDMFIMLTSSMEDGFEQIPYDGNLVKNIEKYRVTGGEYAGGVGYYRRIKRISVWSFLLKAC